MPAAFEQHFSVKQIATRWNVSIDLARSLFRDRDDVIKIARPKTRRKRAYTTLRIPESVVARVHAELRAAPR